MPGWANSNRRDELPKDWPRIRARILRRDPTCAACGLNASVDVDHITPGDNHDPANLQGLCRHCHKRKTIAERPRPASARRPDEAHPGLISKSQQRRGNIMSEQPAAEQQPEEADQLEVNATELQAADADEADQAGDTADDQA